MQRFWGCRWPLLDSSCPTWLSQRLGLIPLHVCMPTGELWYMKIFKTNFSYLSIHTHIHIYPPDIYVCVYCTPMFIAAFSIIARLWKEPKCPSTDEWTKMWFIYTMECYLAMRKNEIWTFVATWMELESVMLSEISQAEKDRYHMFSLICGS